jgi:hypothetical protein
MRSLEAAVLFAFVVAASVFLAFYVDMLAQSALDREVEALAKSTQDLVAAQLRDVLTVASFGYVRNFTYMLYVPTEFPTLDAYVYNATIYVGGDGVLYVNVSFVGFRGSGVSRFFTSSAVGNVTSRAKMDGVRLYLSDPVAAYELRPGPPHCVAPRGVNLTQVGCAALLTGVHQYYVLYVIKR